MFLQTFNWDRAALLNAFGTALAPCECGAVSIQSEFISQGLILTEWIRYNSPVLSDTVIDQYLESIKERARSKEGRNSVGNYKFIAPLGDSVVLLRVSIPRLFYGGRSLWPPTVPWLAVMSSQSNPRGSGPEVLKREGGYVTAEAGVSEVGVFRALQPNVMCKVWFSNLVYTQ